MTDVGVQLCCATAMLIAVLVASILFWAIAAAREESRIWRRLAQLVAEKLVHAPLPVDEHPTAPPESSLALPPDLQEELDRQRAEDAE